MLLRTFPHAWALRGSRRSPSRPEEKEAVCGVPWPSLPPPTPPFSCSSPEAEKTLSDTFYRQENEGSERPSGLRGSWAGGREPGVTPRPDARPPTTPAPHSSSPLGHVCFSSWCLCPAEVLGGHGGGEGGRDWGQAHAHAGTQVALGWPPPRPRGPPHVGTRRAPGPTGRPVVSTAGLALCLRPRRGPPGAALKPQPAWPTQPTGSHGTLPSAFPMALLPEGGGDRESPTYKPLSLSRLAETATTDHVCSQPRAPSTHLGLLSAVPRVLCEPKLSLRTRTGTVAPSRVSGQWAQPGGQDLWVRSPLEELHLPAEGDGLGGQAAGAAHSRGHFLAGQWPLPQTRL